MLPITSSITHSAVIYINSEVQVANPNLQGKICFIVFLLRALHALRGVKKFFLNFGHLNLFRISCLVFRISFSPFQSWFNRP